MVNQCNFFLAGPPAWPGRAPSVPPVIVRGRCGELCHENGKSRSIRLLNMAFQLRMPTFAAIGDVPVALKSFSCGSPGSGI